MTYHSAARHLEGMNPIADSGALLYAAAIGIAFGAAAGLLFGLGFLAIVALLGISIALLAAVRAHVAFALAAILCAAAALGLVRTNLLSWQESRVTVSRVAGTADVAGTVSVDPDRRATNTHVVIDVASVDGIPARGRVLAEVPANARVSYGDAVVARGALRRPEAFASDGGRVFDYPHYLRLRGIYAIVPRASLRVSSSAGASLEGILFSMKHAFEHSIERVFPQPTASLMEGVLLGERRGLPGDIEQVLVAAGLIHIVILAGYALSLVSQGVLNSLSSLRPRWRYVIAAALLVLFIVMTGAAATTVRAAAMAVIAMLARSIHRSSVALRSLAAVSAGMILYNPMHLLYDESFIISVLATFGLIALSPLCERWLSFVPQKFDLRGIASSTLAVQIFALPALLYFTGTLSPYALPANLFALPALPWVMLFGFCAGILNFIHPVLALLPAMLADVLLRWILLVATVVARVPFGGATIPAFPLWIVIASYVFLAACALSAYRKTRAATFADQSSET